MAFVISEIRSHRASSTGLALSALSHQTILNYRSMSPKFLPPRIVKLAISHLQKKCLTP